MNYELLIRSERWGSRKDAISMQGVGAYLDAFLTGFQDCQDLQD